MSIPRAVAVVVHGARVLVVKRFLQRERSTACAICRGTGVAGPACPGHHYAVLVGGHVEPDETAEEAALRELTEETTLSARIERLLWTGHHNDRPASYFLMTDVVGRPVLSGPEAEENRPDNSFELLWAAPDEFAGLGLYPADVREPLTRLLDRHQGDARTPSTHTAVQITGPDQARLVRDKPVPVPADGQILARVECVGLCFSDVKLRHQFDRHVRKSPVLHDDSLRDSPSYVPGELPTVPGHEVVLRVVAVGGGVSSAVVGGRYVVQANFRDLATAASTGAFGYNFEGGLQQYVLLDERATVAADGESYLIPAPEEPSASQLALVEPWSCVEHAYAVRERRQLRAGGTVLVAGTGGPGGLDLSGSGRRLGTAEVAGLTVVEPAALAPRSVDDLLYRGSDADELERLLPLVANDGLVLIATGGGRFGRPVDVPVGRVHYQNLRIAATTSDDFADCLDAIPSTGELRDGDHVNVVGAGGPTGVMAMVRAIVSSRPKALVEGAVRNPARAAALDHRVARTAAERGVEVRLFDPETEHPRGPVDYCFVMAPVPDLIRTAIADAAGHGIVNVFAGIATDAPCPIDLDTYTVKRLYFVGTSGSGVADMRAVLAQVADGRLDTNLSVGAVSGMAGALDGLDAVRDRRIPGKVVVYPALDDLPLLDLGEMVARYPSVGPLLRDGCWTGPAERELFRVASFRHSGTS
ncbi:NUDIX domain-containing protein [Streptomyces sp. NBC_01465]|uniref:NUDIX domain-containing protein n=1 Tax=Streptomyces sp. NBC_01465 TaxID=2903878 RepID=UPI002E32FC57|nr:NUDIX domain-containing protein [Streptomyces sp. NBC_01465]